MRNFEKVLLLTLECSLRKTSEHFAPKNTSSSSSGVAKFLILLDPINRPRRISECLKNVSDHRV